MELAPIFYALLTLVFVVVILRLRKISMIRAKNEPIRPRSTYRRN